MAAANPQTPRQRWASEYREARKVRRFERALLPDGGVSSLGHAAPFDAYLATLKSGVWLDYSRRNGRFGEDGRMARFVGGPLGRLPA